MNDKATKKRTPAQNRALHMWFDMLANDLNERGLYMQQVLAKKSVDVPWTKDRVKEVLYKPILEAYSGKRSTTEMTTKDIDAMLDILTKHLGENFGIYEPFPSIEQIILQQQDETS